MSRLSSKQKDRDTIPPLTIELGVLLLRVVAWTATSERDEPGGSRHRAVCTYCGGKSAETHASASGVLDLPISHREPDCPGNIARDLWNREGLDILRARVCHETSEPSTPTGRSALEGEKQRRERSERFWAARDEQANGRAKLAAHQEQADAAAAPELAQHEQGGTAAEPELAQQRLVEQAGAAVAFELTQQHLERVGAAAAAELAQQHVVEQAAAGAAPELAQQHLLEQAGAAAAPELAQRHLLEQAGAAAPKQRRRTRCGGSGEVITAGAEDGALKCPRCTASWGVAHPGSKWKLKAHRPGERSYERTPGFSYLAIEPVWDESSPEVLPHKLNADAKQQDGQHVE